jgi:hypothetical protein
VKKIFLILLLIPLVSSGQKSNDADALKLCVALQSNNFTTDAEAEDAVSKILSVIGASQKPILQACSNINNAVAAVYKGQRYILYDRDFMNSLTAGSNQYWSNMFILAHEVGHHINGHSLDIILYANDVIDPKSLEERRKQELEADEFAGFVLAKLGASLRQASLVMQNIPSISNENTSTHPSRNKRIASVNKGFKKGDTKKEIVNQKSSQNKKLNKNIDNKGNWSGYGSTINDWIKAAEKREGRKLDPFELNDVKNWNPEKQKKSFSSGISYRTGNKTESLQLEIFQRKYRDIKGPFSDGSYYNIRKAQRLNNIQQKYMPFMEIRIYLNDFKEMPKFQRFGNNPEYKKFDEGFIVKFHYIIDDNIRGYFLVELDGYEQDMSVPLIKNSKGEWEREYVKYIPEGIELGRFENNEEEILNLIKFIDGIKVGKKLYLKMGNERMSWDEYFDNREWTIDNDLECYTYEFDLTGSSKALQL